MKLLTIACLSLLLVACDMHPSPVSHRPWSVAMHDALSEHAATAKAHFAPLLKRDHLPYPPKDLAFLVFKQSKKVEVYAKGVKTDWRYVTTYPIKAASGGLGPKLHEGDRQVPEGIYHIVGLNPESRFDLSMHLNYPNPFDRKEASADHRGHLGGNIYMHGSDRSIGCVALGNSAIEEIFPLVYRVGEKHVTVVIAPEDFRLHHGPIKTKVSPMWLSTLYTKIKQKLQRFPAPQFAARKTS